MAASAFPDRERRHLLQFHLLPRLTYGVRFSLACLLILAALAAQLLWTGAEFGLVLLVTGPFLLCGNLLLLARGYDLRPKHEARHAVWERSTRERFRQVLELDAKVRGWDETAVDLTCKLGCGLFLALLVILLGATFAVHEQLGPAGRHFTPIFLVDAGLLLVPQWVTGVRRGWRPTALREVIAALETVLETIDRYEEPACQIQPMLLVSGQGEGQRPHDARVFVRFPDADENFLGVQFQVSLNNVQGTNYPYLYAVLVAKKMYGLADHLDFLRRRNPNLTVELGLEEDVDVIVIRRPTTRTSGYHTPARWVRRIATGAFESVSEVLE